MPDVKLRLLKDNIVVGTVVHKAGDVVTVPPRRAEAMLKYREAVPHAPDLIGQATAPDAPERATAPRQR